MAANFNVVGIGNAIVDVFAPADDAFIEANGLNRGAMNLIDADEAERLYAKMAPGRAVSGGSAANTIAGIASLGGSGGYIGKVCDDQLGEVFRHDIRAAGVAFETPPLSGPDAPPTARSLILVTPDAQRTMNTFLGACVELGPEDIDPAMIARAQVTYLEGYLWDRPKAKEAFIKAAKLAHAGGRRVSLTLSDSFCVERHRDSFRDLVTNHVDILFANDEEMRSLYETQTLEEALNAIHGDCELTVVTRSGDGSVVVDGVSVYEVDVEPVERVVDTTGAGDLYAAGFLYGFTQGKHPAECGRIGSIAAAEIVSHYGARPERNLAKLLAATRPDPGT